MLALQDVLRCHSKHKRFRHVCHPRDMQICRAARCGVDGRQTQQKAAQSKAEAPSRRMTGLCAAACRGPSLAAHTADSVILQMQSSRSLQSRAHI